MIAARRRQQRQSKPSSRDAIAYVRVSTEDQRNGPDAQRADIERWAAANGVTVRAWCSDIGVSGAAPLDERPALLEALSALRENGAGILVAAKRDRLARDVGTAAAIERLAREAGAQVATADGLDSSDTPEGQLVRCIIDAMAQYERALIRARTKAALRAKRGRGERTGSVPFGFRDFGGHLVPFEAEQAALVRMREFRDAGMTQAQIADALAAEGFKPRGSRWHVTTVARALSQHTETLVGHGRATVM
jgi:DNA invertase Pin-like site-specific DNA recombinase